MKEGASLLNESFLHGWLAEGGFHSYGGHLLAVHPMVCLPVVLASSHASSCAYLYDTNFM